MNQGLEKITEIKNQEKIARIYIGKIDGREFIQYVLNEDNKIYDMEVFIDTAKDNAQEQFGMTFNYEQGLSLVYKLYGVFISQKMQKKIVNGYEIKNGFYFDKETRRISEVEKTESRRELNLIGLIQNYLLELKGDVEIIQ
ncbi:MAG: hypothetical protein AABX16_02455 [Nanoarchaeota archaeon]